ncbi:MAG TPA: TonB-dependent receptor [Anaeromyxobacteraceae bacterium]|nr:TonB-dependent receptor [Anaeromyxobacteraceae bacterium]
MSRQGSRLRGALALAFLFPLAAHAEDPPPVALDEVVVRLPRAEAEGDSTASATIVEADRFAGEAKDVAELVATAPGVAVNDYGGLGQLATASIRGSTADGVLVLVDGLPLNSAFGGGVDLSTIPRHWIDRIEVVRGPEGARYGSGSLGGVLNVVTRRPEAGRWAAELGAGSFESYSVAADGAAGGDGWTALAAAAADTTSGRFPFTWDDTQNVAGNALELERDRNGARRAAGLLKLDAALLGGRLDALVQLGAGRRDVAPAPTDRDSPVRRRQEDARAIAMVRLSGLALRPNLSLSTRVHGRLDRLDLQVPDAPSEQRGAAGGAEVEAALLAGAALVTASVEGGGETLDDTFAGGHSRGSAAATLTGEAPLLAGRVRLAPALRLDRVGPFEGWSAKLGATARLVDGLTLRASGGRTFRAPGFAELYLRQGLVRPNPDLVPEEGLGADAALVLEGRPGFASVGAYATRYEDLILYDDVSMGFLAPRNMGRAVVRGLELEGATTPVRRLLGLAVSGSYTLLASRNLRGAAAELGKWLPHRARHRAYARASVSPGRFDAHLEGHWVGRQYKDTRNLHRIPASVVVNAGTAVRFPVRAPVALALEVKNVLDDRTLVDPIGNPLPGRTVMLTLRAGATAHLTEGTPK